MFEKKEGKKIGYLWFLMMKNLKRVTLTEKFMENIAPISKITN